MHTNKLVFAIALGNDDCGFFASPEMNVAPSKPTKAYIMINTVGPNPSVGGSDAFVINSIGMY